MSFSWQEFWTWLTTGESRLGLIVIGVGLGFFTRHILSRLIDPTIYDLKTKSAGLENKLADKTKALGLCQDDRSKFKQRLAKYDSVREALLAEEDELWRLHPEIPPGKYFKALSESRVKIISIANHKGGVGKTTLTANLAAYFEKRLGKRVLAIDLDYQGSLSAVMLRSANLAPNGSLADDILEGRADGRLLVRAAQRLQPSLPKTSIVTANYDLYRVENKVMLRWLLDEITTDIRYHLGTVLLSDEIQNNYDVVILDTPPRLTTSAINAMCASHHVLIPTVPDDLSTEAVGRFVGHLKGLQGSLNPGLNLLGVVVNLSAVAVLKDSEKDAMAVMKRDFDNLGLSCHVFKRHIPRLAALSVVAGEDIAYLTNKLFREGIMDPLGDEIAQRIGFGVPNES